MAKKCTNTYSVYLHKTPNGMIYAGSTALEPKRRWQGGSGYKTNRLFYPLIAEYGWDNIEHKVVATGLGEDFARYLEHALVGLTLKEFRLNPYDSYYRIKNDSERRFITECIYEQDIAGFYGDSLDTRTYNIHFTNESVICGKSHFLTNNETMKRKKQTVKKLQPMAVKHSAGVKFELMLDTRYQKQDGTFPLTVRLYQNRKYRHIQTGYSAEPSTFPSFTKEEEEHIYKIFNSVCADVTRAALQDGSADILSVSVKTKDVGTLVDLMREKCRMLSNDGTVNNYKSAAKAVLKVYPDGLKCERVNPSTIAKLLDFMKGEGLAAATINIYLSAIKASVNFGIYKGYIKAEQYPFKRNPYEVDKVTLPKSGKRDENYFTQPQMQEVWEYFKRTQNPYIGTFLFSYLCGGMNLADIIELKFDDFYFDEGGFRFSRNKTKGKNDFKTTVPSTKLTEELFRILNIVPQKGEFVFKMFAKKKGDYFAKKRNISSYINKSLDSMMQMLTFEKKCTMTTARHSFATIANKQGMPFNMVEAAMSHSNGGVSSHYIGGWDVSEMRPWFEKLLTA